MNRLAVCAAALLIGTGGAFAADDIAAPMVVAPSDIWSGFYIGLQGGYGRSTDLDVWSDTQHEWLRGGGYDFTTDFAESSDRLEGLFGGAHVGYNIQNGNWVFGIEGDVNASDISAGTHASTFAERIGESEYTRGYTTASADVDWHGSVRGRLGMAHGNILAYVTGGVAFGKVDLRGRVDADYSFDNGADLRSESGSFSDSSTEVGWTAGFGVDYAVSPRFVVGAFYRFVDLGSVSAGSSQMEERVFGGPGFFDRGFVDGGASVDAKFHTIGLKASLKFGG